MPGTKRAQEKLSVADLERRSVFFDRQQPPGGAGGDNALEGGLELRVEGQGVAGSVKLQNTGSVETKLVRSWKSRSSVA